MERLLKADDVAQRTGLARSTVFAFAARGVIPHVRLGNAVRFPERALDEWIKASIRGGGCQPVDSVPGAA